MPWINIRPKNIGGGRQPGEPTARLYESGQLTLSHAAVALLGHPPKVRVQVDPEAQRIRLQPATPTDNGAFALSGGGNSPSRLKASDITQRWPGMVGEYRVVRCSGGVECWPVEPI